MNLNKLLHKITDLFDDADLFVSQCQESHIKLIFVIMDLK